ncbi:MAG: hypothetical protein COV45_03815 [Deltaproteobacteria bacterium CG11_big_fil_rev_8_21_14_0_20_47_16]|nr:MAG: hypothetical protein COV45_03815 [Deltaproteobacteria bacterium CG11_big_fil_rev_8_21_14_0_20_47_16]
MAEFEPKQFGKFFLLDKLAIGGMAEIYKAKTFGAEGFEKLLAIKRILPHCAADKDFISMLIDEAKLSVLLSHANIVQVYDLGKVGDDYFISMEYISGVNLRDLVYRCRELGRTIPTDIAVYIISEICKGLDYAHRKTDTGGQPLHLVHRDISPQNVLISYEGEVKIVDFGIAKAAMNISHTMAGILKGKIAYMSPEQALGKSIDHRTDIFSTGILLYEALTGEKLFSGESQFEVLKKIRSTKIDLSRLPTSIPKPLQVILARALAYFPKDRFQSAGDMQIELTKFLYSTYHDFSPQKLAGFVRETFSNQLTHQNIRAQTSALRESKTGSISLAQEALQEDIVHRDETGAALRKSSLSSRTQRPLKPLESISEPTDRTDNTQRSIVWRMGIIVATLTILASLGGIYWMLIHPRLFPPVVTSEPILGEAIIDSTPPGAAITLNGTDTTKTTPARLTDLQVGESYTLKLSKPGYESQELPLVVTNSTTPTSITITLMEARGVLDLSTVPAGAEILLDGAPTGKFTPDTINNITLNANHRLLLRKEGYTDYEQIFNLTNDTPQTVEITLQSKPEIPATPPPAVEPEKPVQKVEEKIEEKKVEPVKQLTLSVRSTPAGAKMVLDGRSVGTTPGKLPALDVGSTHTLILEKDGFTSSRRKFTVSDKTSTLSVTMKEVIQPQEKPQEPIIPQPKPKEEPTKPAEQPKKAIAGGVGTIKVSSSPSGADVFINGEMRGTTPTTVSGVSSGTVKIIVSKEGQARYTTQVSLNPGETKNLGTVTLGNIYGEVSVSSSPAGASVSLDGTNYGTTPINIRKVKRDRPHRIRITLDGHQPWERAFTFDNDDVKKFNVSLEAQ